MFFTAACVSKSVPHASLGGMIPFFKLYNKRSRYESCAGNRWEGFCERKKLHDEAGRQDLAGKPPRPQRPHQSVPHLKPVCASSSGKPERDVIRNTAELDPATKYEEKEDNDMSENLDDVLDFTSLFD